MTDGSNRSFVVLGGAGTIGRVVVRDLVESHSRNHVLIADYNEAAARAYARLLRTRRVSMAFADAGKPKQLAKLFRGHRLVINCTQHDFNLKVMQAALAAEVHYIDLGGLFHWTRRQLKLNGQFERAGLTAVLGAGCSPGITNILTRAAVERCNRAASVHIRVGSRDLHAKPGDFFFPYSAQTVVEELTHRPWIFTRGKFLQVKPRSRWERVRFSTPVGPQWVVRTRHSEIATIPAIFNGQGLRECDFKVGFSRKFVRKVMSRLAAGWTVRDFAKLPAPRGKPNDYEVSRVIVRGSKKKVTMDCLAKANRRWHASAGDIDTGCPPSIIAQMIATGIITQRGVLPPEVAVPVEPFFKELRKRGMKIVVKESQA